MEIRYTCDACGGLLEVRGDWAFSRASPAGRPWRLWRYRELLPVPSAADPVSLGEGGTPLVDCPRLAEWAGVRRVLVKAEGANPTGSFKDRGMTLGVTLARALGVRTVACASTGNTSASLAAYGARAGLDVLVLVPAGKVARGKIAQAVAHGARVVAVDGDFDRAMALVEALSREGHAYLLNSLNPLRLEGQKTLAFEIVEELGWRAPDRIVFPVGNAGNSSAAWKGLTELSDLGLLADLPRISGVQADGASPVAKAWDAKADRVSPERAETVATAIRIGDPVNAVKVLRALRESGGSAIAVPDVEILAAQKRLAREGVFVEPASAAPLAGLARMVERGDVARSEEVVLVATGNGLKDPDVIDRWPEPVPIRTSAPDLDSLKKVVLAP